MLFKTANFGHPPDRARVLVEVRPTTGKISFMEFIARLGRAGFLAAFAASAVAYAADSGKMAASMVLSDEALEMLECATPCGDSDAGGSAAICDMECGAGGFAAVLAPQAQRTLQTPREILASPAAQTSDDLAAPLPSSHHEP